MEERKGKHLRKKVIAGNTKEFSNYYSGRYKNYAPRLPAEKRTEERMRRWQDKRAEDNCRHAIHCNFGVGDLFATLHYPPKTRKSSEEIREDIKELLRQLRKLFKKTGAVLKYIFTVGRGKRGAIHFHMVLNQMSTKVLEDIWQDITGTDECPYPSVYIRHLDRSGYYPKVAAYLIKNAKETFWSEDRIYGKRYCASRNLKKPIIKVEEIGAKTWLKEPRQQKGYYIDKNYNYNGFDGAGYPYQSYVMVKLQI